MNTTVSFKHIDASSKRVSTISTSAIPLGFGECQDATGLLKYEDSNRGRHIVIQYMATQANCPIIYEAPDFSLLDHYEAGKYLGFKSGSGVFFLSNPNGLNNQVIRLPSLAKVQDATYYMKVANERIKK